MTDSHDAHSPQETTTHFNTVLPAIPAGLVDLARRDHKHRPQLNDLITIGTMTLAETVCREHRLNHLDLEDLVERVCHTLEIQVNRGAGGLWNAAEESDPNHKALWAYIRRVVFHTAVRMLRHPEYKTRINHETASNHASEEPGDNKSLDSTHEVLDLDARLSEALRKLNAADRWLVVLHVVRGRTFPDLAGELLENTDTLRGRFLRAIRSLRKLMDENE